MSLGLVFVGGGAPGTPVCQVYAAPELGQGFCPGSDFMDLLVFWVRVLLVLRANRSSGITDFHCLILLWKMIQMVCGSCCVSGLKARVLALDYAGLKPFCLWLVRSSPVGPAGIVF